MKVISQYSKKGMGFISAYWNSEYETLNQCYGRWSIKKQLAYDYCMKLCREENGKSFRIISWNQCFFTCAWLSGEDLRVETASNSYLIKDILINLPF